MEGHFGQFVADNVDHNLRTLGGHDTFYGLGFIVTTTPGLSQKRVIPRVPSTDHSKHDAKIAITYHKSFAGKNSQLLYEKLPQLDVINIFGHLI